MKLPFAFLTCLSLLPLMTAGPAFAQTSETGIVGSVELFVSSAARRAVLQSQPAPTTDCDRRAASADDHQRVDEGVFFRDIDAASAILSCERAVEAFPHELRFIYQLGRAYEKAGRMELAVDHYRRAHEGGYAMATTALGILYMHGDGVERDYAQARVLLEQATDQGNGLAMANLGVMHEHGRAGAEDTLAAYRLYRRSAEAGNLLGMTNLAVAYEEGIGAAPDIDEAARLFRRAAEGGNIRAMTRLGLLLENGRGVERDYAAASQLYRKAAALGDTYALNNLAVLYANGRGVPRNDEEANRLFQEAADAGNSLSMRNLALSYSRGRGLRQDPAQAAYWMVQAALAGQERALEDLRERPRQFTSQFWREFQRLMREEGRYLGRVDGIYGPATRASLEGL